MILLSVLCVAAATFPAQAEEEPDLKRGAKLFGKCEACHTVAPDGRNKVGPRLYGVFGRQAGSVPDYAYSEAMKEADIVWNEETLNDYLAATQDYIPGSKMYGGLALEEDRRDLIAWLKKVTTPDNRASRK